MKNSLEQWVDDSGGVPRVARVLGVIPHSVRVWLRGEGTPRVKTILKIVQLSRGELSFEQIAREATRNKRKESLK
jgi:DNA-binding phage protein